MCPAGAAGGAKTRSLAQTTPFSRPFSFAPRTLCQVSNIVPSLAHAAAGPGGGWGRGYGDERVKHVGGANGLDRNKRSEQNSRGKGAGMDYVVTLV